MTIPFHLEPGYRIAYDVEEYSDRFGSEGTKRWTAEFDVLESSNSGSVVACRLGLDGFGDQIGAFISRMRGKNDDFAIELVLDRNQMVTGIRNWRATADVMDQAFLIEIERERARRTPEQWAEIRPMLEHGRKLYTSKEYLEAYLGNKFSRIFWPVGMTFDTDRPRVMESTLAMPISGMPIPAKVSFEVIGDYPDQLVVEIVQTFDSERGTAAIVRAVKDMIPSKAADIDEKFAKQTVDFRAQAHAEINRADGWVDEIEVQIQMRMMDEKGYQKEVWIRRQ